MNINDISKVLNGQPTRVRYNILKASTTYEYMFVEYVGMSLLSIVFVKNTEDMDYSEEGDCHLFIGDSYDCFALYVDISDGDVEYSGSKYFSSKDLSLSPVVIPSVSDILRLPVKSTSHDLYDFLTVFSDDLLGGSYKCSIREDHNFTFNLIVDHSVGDGTEYSTELYVMIFGGNAVGLIVSEGRWTNLHTLYITDTETYDSALSYVRHNWWQYHDSRALNMETEVSFLPDAILDEICN